MIRPCPNCSGEGFVRTTCDCREVWEVGQNHCPHDGPVNNDTEPQLGVYHKFYVRRMDGSSRNGEKHALCSFFVLDWVHDPFAVAAARAYADACEETYPELAVDLRDWAERAVTAWEERTNLSKVQVEA